MSQAHQGGRDGRLGSLLAAVVAGNPFYREKYRDLLAAHGPGWAPSPAELTALPFTTKGELVADQARHPPFGTNHTVPLERFTRLHRTSGTTGRPLYWLDTAESWAWWLDCWAEIYRAAGVTAGDRVFVPFSFGPFIGFWAGFEAAGRVGAMAVPGGGLDSARRLELMVECGATVVVATPTYALHLAEVARAEGIDLAAGPVRVTIHAGEPGANVPNVKARIEAAWGARAVDHVGATEVGAWGYACGEADHLHVNEAEFVAELLPAGGGAARPLAAAAGETGELVLTNLGRSASPVVRYRTADLVAVGAGPCPCGRESAFLAGGVLGRADGMVVVRGINVFPSALEDAVRGFPAIAEFEVEVDRSRELAELVIRIEVADGDPAAVAAELAASVHRRLALRPRVEPVAAGSLPRYELKARRFKLA
jgi:phenylacetate-CoA ligase